MNLKLHLHNILSLEHIVASNDLLIYTYTVIVKQSTHVMNNEQSRSDLKCMHCVGIFLTDQYSNFLHTYP